MVKGTYAKGRKAELELVKYLESQGFKCISAPKGNRFSKQKDLFDHWDIVAYKPQRINYNGEWVVIQVKSNTTGGVLKKLIEVSKELPEYTGAMLAIRLDNKSSFEQRWRFIDLRP